ncbi:hypothetical protein SM007_35380 [Streptomyces avermitilis]|uniref:Uncharacterized protein n=1 Tax=Streptomyces avermitilis TaxID=33903 RepID=A0A4D4MIP1_STRAX|nr:hypothetical protein SM007_35380 [Streptomyces avermitilis]BBJ56171.1 hypothetical protein SAVMC3_88000 [Streptomyces avermitilis]GDY68114.1 hypothetical protein SAV14893_075070 [Streptomyces avermitilis]GDY71545.1 hypothetical protein SAV31267_010300 [Streptomyces avermitilis]
MSLLLRHAVAGLTQTACTGSFLFSADRLIVTADANEFRNVTAVGDGYWLRGPQHPACPLITQISIRSSQIPLSPLGLIPAALRMRRAPHLS